VTGQEFVEPMGERDDDDPRETGDAHPADCKGYDAPAPGRGPGPDTLRA
jgi:hypothetical protein